MKILEVKPLHKPIVTEVEIPGSKSYTNRALLLAALTPGPVILRNALACDDTEAMIGCLRQLGIRITVAADRLIVHDDISVVQEGNYELFAHDSGTTIRFILALLCLVPGSKILSGSRRLNERPIKDLVDALRQLGAKITYLEEQGQPPLHIQCCSLYGRERVALQPEVSSQFLSSLLMITPLLGGIEIALRAEPISKPYVDMTVDLMRQWGIEVLSTKEGFTVRGGQHYQKKEHVIEGDFSSAGYFLAIAALTQSTITLKNLSAHSLQADNQFLTILEKMGNRVIRAEGGITIKGEQILAGELSMEDCPDQVQTMAVLAAFTKGATLISGVRSLRLKETERVVALERELAKMGIKTEQTHDTLTIYGGAPHAAEIDTYGDHRMAMAFAVAGTKLPGIKIRNPEVVNKTFPTFWEKLRSL